jgi:DNA polymerase
MSDPTRFDLDDRQRAMLAEMGVRVWWPQRSDVAADEPRPQAQSAPEARVTPQADAFVAASPAQAVVLAEAPTPTRPEPRPSPVRAVSAAVADHPPLPEGVAQMDWAALQEAASACQACALCAARQAPILGTGHAQATWMVVGDLPSEEDDQQGQPFTGPEGVLLDNMLKAVGARRQTRDPQGPGSGPGSGAAEAYLTHAVKCRPPGGRNPEASELAVCAHYLSRQVALVQPRVILAMGRFAIQSLLGTTEPMGKLRGRLHEFQGVPVVVTYPPSTLLRNPADKAKAWADLVLALTVAKG